MSMQIRQTTKSTLYTFDGYSDGYKALVQGAFTGTFVVPKEFATLVQVGNELESLREMHQDHQFRIILRNAGRVQ